jgi:hypothetical protein
MTQEKINLLLYGDQQKHPVSFITFFDNLKLSNTNIKEIYQSYMAHKSAFQTLSGERRFNT